MRIGIPKELKNQEKRVVLLPKDVGVLVKAGHEVWVERGAGLGIGILDRAYRVQGAKIISSAKKLWEDSQLILKVKEPQEKEYRYFRKDLWLFCFLHLAANPRLLRALQKSQISALAFETLVDAKGRTPLLKPMSQIAGRLATQLGLEFLRSDQGGKGILLSPTEASPPGRVLVVGGGNVGRAAAEVAVGLGAQVQVIDRHIAYLKKWAGSYPNLSLHPSRPSILSALIKKADLVIGAIYVTGAKTPQLISKNMVKSMEPGSVLVDVAVDQGGASETTQVTSITKPSYIKYGVIHSAIPNLPALVSRTASQALSSILLPYVKRLSRYKNIKEIERDKNFSGTLNVHCGEIKHPQLRKIFAG